MELIIPQFRGKFRGIYTASEDRKVVVCDIEGAYLAPDMGMRVVVIF
jgi:hypothetical protein